MLYTFTLYYTLLMEDLCYLMVEGVERERNGAGGREMKIESSQKTRRRESGLRHRRKNNKKEVMFHFFLNSKRQTSSHLLPGVHLHRETHSWLLQKLLTGVDFGQRHF